MAIYLIKQIPDDYAESIGLSKYNRSRMPKCKDSFQAAYNDRNGTFVTGLSDVDVVTYSKELKQDLSERGTFWETFYVTIHSDSPRSFDTSNILDDISYKLVIANNYVVPDKDSMGNPKYKDSGYYAYTEETENAEEISSRKKRDKALAILLNMSENKDKLLLYGQYLEGLKYSGKLSVDTLFKLHRAYIEDKNISNVNSFLKALDLSPEELQKKIFIDKALKQQLIKRVNVGNKKSVYQYGQITVGATLEEVYINLSSVDYAPEFLTIKKELEHN